MAGFDNDVMYSRGVRLEASTSQDIFLMQQTATDVSRINHTGNPEGVVAANPSSLSHDPVSGDVYFKQTGTGNTGWALIPGGGSVLTTLTPDSGGVQSPTAGNINTFGSGSITTVGSGSTITTQLTGLTNHAVLIGAGTTTITKVGPSASTGQILQNNAAADPSYSIATFPSSTTINQILYSSATNTVSGLATANRAVLTTGTTGTPVLTALATDGQLIIGSTAGTPSAALLTPGTGISITNGSNSISIAVSGSVVGQTITGNSGGALSPTAGNWNILGTSTAAGTSPVNTSGSGSTLTVNVQKSQAIASSDATKIGLANFNSAQFSVDANGFVSSSATGILNTLTGNSGGAISPTSGNINTLGSGSITISGSGSTLTTQLTGLTNHAIQIGAGTATLTQLGPTATAGQVLQSAGSSADPAFSTATFPASTTINQVLYSSSNNVVGGITAGIEGVLISSHTGVPSWLANGNAGYILTANTNLPPSWQVPPASGITTIQGDTGSISGTTVSIKSNATSGASTSFQAGGTAMTFNVTDTNGNTFLGNGCGNSTLTGTGANTCLGVGVSQNLTTGSSNVIIGAASGSLIDSGTDNTIISFSGASGITSGSFNIIIGSTSGISYISGDSSNICISNFGNPGDSNIIRIGDQGAGPGLQNQCFIAGIATIAQSSLTLPALTYLDTTTGQLGAVVATDSDIATSAFGTTLTAGTGKQNTTGYGLLLNISVSITAATTATITMGVGTTSTPTTNTIDASFTTAAVITKSFCAFVPHLYYVLVNTTGTITIGSITVQACAIG